MSVWRRIELVNLHEAIASRLKTEREARNLSQQELASRLGVAPNTVSRWETGTYRPRLDDLVRIAGALNLEVGDFLADNQPAERKPLERLMQLASRLSDEDLAELERFAEFRRVRSTQ